MTLREDPGQSAVPDLEDMLGMDLGPEYVLVHIPPDVWHAWSSRQHQRPLQGLWGLFPAGEWKENRLRPPPEDRVLLAPRSAPEPLLAEWVHQKLGYHGLMINGVPHWLAPTWIDPEQVPRRNHAHDPRIE